MVAVAKKVLQWAGVDVQGDIVTRCIPTIDFRSTNGNDFRSICFYFGPLVPSEPPPSEIYLNRENHPTALVRILSMLQKDAGFPSLEGAMIISVLDYVTKIIESSYFPRYDLQSPISLDVLGLSCSQIVDLLMNNMLSYMAPFTLSTDEKTKLSTRIQNVALSASSSASQSLNALYVGDIATSDKDVTSFFFYMEALVQITSSGKTEFQQRTIYLYCAKFPLDSDAVIRDAQKLTTLEAISVGDYVESHNT